MSLKVFKGKESERHIMNLCVNNYKINPNYSIWLAYTMNLDTTYLTSSTPPHAEACNSYAPSFIPI